MSTHRSRSSASSTSTTSRRLAGQRHGRGGLLAGRAADPRPRCRDRRRPRRSRPCIDGIGAIAQIQPDRDAASTIFRDYVERSDSRGGAGHRRIAELASPASGSTSGEPGRTRSTSWRPRGLATAGSRRSLTPTRTTRAPRSPDDPCSRPRRCRDCRRADPRLVRGQPVRDRRGGARPFRARRPAHPAVLSAMTLAEVLRAAAESS